MKSRLVGLFALLVVMVGVSLAAPILPRKPRLPDEVRCLTGLKRVNIGVDSLPPDLINAGASTTRLNDLLRDRLTKAGFEVVDDAGAPRLVVQCFTSADPQIPNVVSVTTLLGVNQAVVLKRLEEDMILPVATVVSTAVGNRNDLAKLSEREVERVVDMLDTFVQQTR